MLNPTDTQTDRAELDEWHEAMSEPASELREARDDQDRPS